VSFKAFDLGGHAAVRKLWTDYMTDVDAVVFVVDSNDAARHDEARDVSTLLAVRAALSALVPPCARLVHRGDTCRVGIAGAAQGGRTAGG
jgi:hypothetical protein